MNNINNVNNPLVSVIIPTYNRAGLLNRAVNSVLNQTYDNYEIIIIDDASKDNTEDTIKNFLNDRVIYLRHRKNKGAAAARNTGIKEAKGTFIAFLDSDDEWEINKLKMQIDHFSESQKIGVICTGLIYVKKENCEVSRMMPNVEGDISKKIVLSNIVGPLSTGMVKKECFHTCGYFDENLPACQDWDLWIRIAKQYRFSVINEYLVKYHIDNIKISTNYEQKALGHRMILQKYLPEIEKNKKAFSYQKFLISHHLLLSGKFDEARQVISSATGAYPFVLKYHLYWFGIAICPSIFRRFLIYRKEKNIS